MPVAPANVAEPLVSQLQAETVRDPDDFLSDLDASLAACKTADQLDEVWAENLETISYLGMQPRQKAELIYDRHHSRIMAREDVLNTEETQMGAAA